MRIVTDKMLALTTALLVGMSASHAEGSAQARAPLATKGAPASVSPKPAAKAPVQKKPARRRAASARVFVPPPPPTVPVTTPLTFMSGMPIELLSEQDLIRQRQQTDEQLRKARVAARQNEQWGGEKKERAELFVSLYKEGVVSRRELEGAQREASQAEIDLTDARLKMTDLERDMKKIDSRLKQLAESRVKAPPAQPSARKATKKAQAKKGA